MRLAFLRCCWVARLGNKLLGPSGRGAERASHIGRERERQREREGGKTQLSWPESCDSLNLMILEPFLKSTKFRAVS